VGHHLMKTRKDKLEGHFSLKRAEIHSMWVIIIDKNRVFGKNYRKENIKDQLDKLELLEEVILQHDKVKEWSGTDLEELFNNNNQIMLVIWHKPLHNSLNQEPSLDKQTHKSALKCIEIQR